ncbi:MAG: O-antigen ligase family protein [Flavobacteriales bacterium]
MTAAEKRVNRGYAFGMGWTAFAMVFSNLFMSWGAMALVLAWGHDRWVLGPLFKGRDRSFIQGSTVLLAVVALMGWQILGLGWSEDFSNGLSQLRIKLPFLVFPLVLLTGRWDRRALMQWWPYWYAAMVGLGCAAALLAGWLGNAPSDARGWSPFISHIRFSLMIATAWGWMGAIWLHKKPSLAQRKAGWMWSMLTLLGGLFICQTTTLTGIVLLPIVGMALVWWAGLENMGWSPKGSHQLLLAAWLTLVLGTGGVMWQLRPVWPNLSEFPTHSADGEAYMHHPDRCLRENGHYIWMNIAWNELQKAWNEQSEIPFYGHNARGLPVRMTLIRYMTSLGLNKDRAGLETLTESDIQRIESGVPSILDLEHHGLMRRFDILKFESDAMWSGIAPSGQSLMQRLAYWKTGWHIFLKSPAWGMGTGDLDLAFAQAYRENDRGLLQPYQLRAHNQFLSFALAGGPVGVMLFFSLFFAMIAVSRRQHEGLWTTMTLLFVLVFFLSCWSEDTLETQAGVTWAGLFIGLLGRRL